MNIFNKIKRVFAEIEWVGRKKLVGMIKIELFWCVYGSVIPIFGNFLRVEGYLLT